MTKYIITPWATSGDRTTIPNTGSSAGPVNYLYGYGSDYSLDQSTNPSALDVERVSFNELMFDVTSILQQYQQFGVPWFITTSDNGGSPFSYSKNAAVRYDNGTTQDNYISLKDSNTDLPTVGASWAKTNGIASVALGGTGLSSGTSGGILYFSSTSAIASSAAFTANALLIGGGAGAAPAALGSLGTTITVLHGNASGAPTFSAVVLTTDVSGILPGANGGTQNGFTAFTGPSGSLKTFTLPNVTDTIGCLGQQNAWTKQQYSAETTLTFNATQTWDVSVNQMTKVTLTANATLSAPTNMVAGGTYSLRVIQDSTGSRTLAYNSVFKWPGGSTPTLSTAPNAIDIITFISDGTNMYGAIQKAFG